MSYSRQGKATEYKKGHYYLTVVEWDDGHCEIEVHRCVPELLLHSCDKNQLSTILETFNKINDIPKLADSNENLLLELNKNIEGLNG